MAATKKATKKATSKDVDDKKLQIKDVAGKTIVNQERKALRSGWRVICYSRSAAGRPW